MSHSSGIPVSDSLKNSFGNAVSAKNKRLFKAVIENEQVIEVSNLPITGSTWDQDIEQVPKMLDKTAACYILFRLDSEGPSGYHWLLMCYVNDLAKVKDKMLYAATRANVKQQLGLNFFFDDIFGTVPNDFSKKGYDLHVSSKKMDAPLTEQEQIKQAEKSSWEIYSGGQSAYVHGVAFPVDNAAIDAIKKLASGSVNYVQIAIDIEKEKIILDHTSSLANFAALGNQISLEEPRFHFYGYQHDYEGQQVTSYIFVYSCPDGSKNTKSAPVKMRMLYSSSKANVCNLMSTSSTNIGAKFEINAADDVTEEAVFEQLHPKAAEKAKTFSKPSRPGKGGARITRSEK